MSEAATILIPHLSCRDAAGAVAFYQNAFGAEATMVHYLPDSRVLHATLNIGDATLFVADELPEHDGLSPQGLGGSPVTLHLQVPDCDAVFARAVAAGCAARMPPQDMFWGDRYATLTDPYGHLWSVATTIRQAENTETLQVTRPTDQEIVLARVFDAPRDVVFDALTKPDALKRWFGPRDWAMKACEVDLQVGGTWRFALRGPDGADFGMRGVYQEIVPSERLVYSEAYDRDDWPDLLVTTDLVEEGGKTTLTSTVLHPSKAVRDANSHMEHGAAETYEKLAEYLASVEGGKDK